MRMRRHLGGWIGALCATWIATTSVHNIASGADEAAKPADSEAIAKGAKVYQMHCIGCHGADGKPSRGSGEGGHQPANLADDEWKNGGTDEAIFKSIKSGVAPDYAMVPWEGVISDEDIANLVRYIRSLHQTGAESLPK